MLNNGTYYNPLLMGALHFGWIDHSVFILMLVVSVVVGTWFGVCGKKHNTAQVDYLLGGKSMNIFPVGVSLAASHISGITLMGAPSEIYMYGVAYALVMISTILTGVIENFIYLPVFYGLQLTSTYEYLEMRFNASARRMASFLFTLAKITFLPICIYVPSLAFSQVSGLSVHIISPVVCFVCIFYTMMGGLKAVVWTDFIQAFVTVGALITVMFMGVWQVGGMKTIFERNYQGGHLDISFDLSPFARNTWWSMLIGNTVSGMAGTGVDQGTMQKFLALPTIAHARWALVVFCAGVMLLQFFSCFSGLLIYAAYHQCDPVKIQAIQRPDQLLPYFVMDTSRHIQGLPGLFVAGVFSSALSSMSSALNSLSGTIYEDFVSPFLTGKLSDEKINIIMKSIVCVIGGICVGLVFVVEKLGAVMELGISLSSITTGALLGLFTLGVFFPWANAKGALAGSLASLAFMAWIVLGAQHEAAMGTFGHPKLPTSVEGCGFNVTDVPDPPPPNHDDVFLLYRVSYMYYSLVGTMTVCIVGLVVSFATGARKPEDIDSRLFVPFVKRWVESKQLAAVSPAETEMLNMKKPY